MRELNPHFRLFRQPVFRAGLKLGPSRRSCTYMPESAPS